MTDSLTFDQVRELGFLHPVRLPDGRIAAIQKNLFTYGIVILDEQGVTHRWCYDKFVSAILAILDWNGIGDPPGSWIKQKLPVERMNPKWSRS